MKRRTALGLLCLCLGSIWASRSLVLNTWSTVLFFCGYLGLAVLFFLSVEPPQR